MTIIDGWEFEDLPQSWLVVGEIEDGPVALASHDDEKTARRSAESFKDLVMTGQLDAWNVRVEHRPTHYQEIK